MGIICATKNMCDKYWPFLDYSPPKQSATILSIANKKLRRKVHSLDQYARFNERKLQNMDGFHLLNGGGCYFSLV